LNKCPRCQSHIVSEKKDYAGIEVIKNICSTCGSRFFFEEDIIAFMTKKQEKSK
jgi:DNA-directed RNA polymerase subunit M/transcription elongation factor TFIIS